MFHVNGMALHHQYHSLHYPAILRYFHLYLNRFYHQPFCLKLEHSLLE